MTKFKDVAHLYLGGECIYEKEKFIIEGIRDTDYFPCTQNTYLTKEKTPESDRRFVNVNNIKPILRPLSDMQEDEQIVVGLISRGIELSEATYSDKIFAKEFAVSWAIRKGSRPVMSVADCVKLTTYLLKQGFDLFGLIENGIAIDKTKITKP